MLTGGTTHGVLHGDSVGTACTAPGEAVDAAARTVNGDAGLGPDSTSVSHSEGHGMWLEDDLVFSESGAELSTPQSPRLGRPCAAARPLGNAHPWLCVA